MMFLFGLVFIFSVNADCSADIKIKTIRGNSMKGLYENGQDISVDQNYYGCHSPQMHDVVLVQKKGFKAPIIKEILVTPGQRFQLVPQGKGHVMLVDGKELENSIHKKYIFSRGAYKMLSLYEKEFKGLMPKDTYFIFGTGLADSRDSTRFGPVLRSEIIGKVLGLKK
ncbi:MAG: signal peptidase I [Bdellovibrionales bacterium]|nr:signal peptidase I [Bdellovibrionales bacterium]